ncbi:MAG TPA: hypothetical protein VM532_18530 [Burkholderiales bacterium]|nr:hypothetical protein [Burkholderiales bacterium]
MLPLREEFSNRYRQIGGRPGEDLNQQAIDERFELFWWKYQETRDWDERFDEHFDAIQIHRRWYAKIKKEFSDWHHEHKGPSGEALSQEEIDKRFHRFFKSYQDSPDIRIDMRNHFAAVTRRRAEKAAIPAADASNDRPQPEFDDANEPTSIDIDSLLEKVEAYAKHLQLLKNNNKHPAEFFFQLPMSSELYIPHMIVAENLRAKEIADFMEDDAFQLDMCYFDSAEDFSWTLIQPPGDGNFNGVVNFGGHAIYGDVNTNGSKTSLVGFDPTSLKHAEPGLVRLDELLGDVPEAVHNLSLTALNMQKAVAGCPFYSLNIGLDVGAAGPRKAVDALHEKQQSVEAGPCILYNDSFGYFIDPSVYALAQSTTQTVNVVNSPKHAHRNLAEAPHNKTGETLYTHNAHHRITQLVGDLDALEFTMAEFSGAPEDKRLKCLGRLIHRLKELQRVHGSQEAGRIFAGHLSKIRIGLQPDWDRYLTAAPALIPGWDVSAGPGQLRIINNHLKLPDGNQRKALMLDVINAIPQWRSPGLRLSSLKLADEFIKAPVNTPFASDVMKEFPHLIDKCLTLLGQDEAMTEKWAQKELAAILKLNTHLVSSLAADGRHLDWLNQLTQKMEQLNSPSLRRELGRHIVEQTTKDCEKNSYTVEHAKILLLSVAHVMDSWNSSQDEDKNDKELTRRFDALFGFQEKLPDDWVDGQSEWSPAAEFGAMIEMAVNYSAQEIKSNMASDGNWLRVSSLTETLENENPDNWLSINDIEPIAEENRSATVLKQRERIGIDWDVYFSRPAPKHAQQVVASGSVSSQAGESAGAASSHRPTETPQQTHERLKRALPADQIGRLASLCPNGYRLIEEPFAETIQGYKLDLKDAPANVDHTWPALIKLDISKQQPHILVLQSNALDDADKATVQNASPETRIAVKFRRSGPVHSTADQSKPGGHKRKRSGP